MKRAAGMRGNHVAKQVKAKQAQKCHNEEKLMGSQRANYFHPKMTIANPYPVPCTDYAPLDDTLASPATPLQSMFIVFQSTPDIASPLPSPFQIQAFGVQVRRAAQSLTGLLRVQFIITVTKY